MRVLVADTDPTSRWVLVRGLKEHTVVECATLKEAKFMLKKSKFDVAIVSRNLPDGDGYTLLEKFPSTKFVIMTVNPAIDNVSYALDQGALGYIKKPLDLDQVREILANVETESRKAYVDQDGPSLLLDSLHVRWCLERIESFMEEETPFLIYGEEGVGKRTLLNHATAGSDYRIVGLNRMCVCMQRELYQKILDGDISSKCAFILRGDPQYLLGSGGLAPELYSLLSGRMVELKPLRERKEDIPLFVKYFRRLWEGLRGRSAPQFSDDALRAFTLFRWENNLNDLRDVVFLCLDTNKDVPVIMSYQLPSELWGERFGLSFIGSLRKDVRNLLGKEKELHDKVITLVERVILEEALSYAGGSRVRASELTGLHRNTIRNKLRKFFGGGIWTLKR